MHLHLFTDTKAWFDRSVQLTLAKELKQLHFEVGSASHPVQRDLGSRTVSRRYLVGQHLVWFGRMFHSGIVHGESE